MLAAAWFASACTPAFGADPSPVPPAFPAPDRFIIELAPLASRGAFARRGVSPLRLGNAGADQVLASLPGAWIEPEFRTDSPPERPEDPDFAAFYVVHLPEGANLDAALDRFRRLPDVRSAHPIMLCPVTEVPNDSLWSLAYYFDQPSGRDIDAVEAWDITHGDTSAVVAVMDTGILPYHPDLPPFWTNRLEARGFASFDDDGNGYIDDVHGWDFVSLDHPSLVTTGEDWHGEDNDPNDFVGHGTLVAGLLGAINNNGIGIAGTAWNVRIIPLRVGWSAPWRQTGIIDMLYLARAIRYATRMGVDVMNLSVSNVYTPDMQMTVRAALDSGITIVVAAGNHGSDNAIAGYALGSAVFVAATDANDALAVWSSRGTFVDLSAPGADLVTTVLTRPGTDSLGLRQPGYVTGANGTSFAAPIVSGAVAMLQGARRSLGYRALDRRQVRTLLRATTDDISSQNPGLTGYGTGRLNLERFVRRGLEFHAVRIPRLTTGPGVSYTTGDGRQVLAFSAGNTGLWRIDAVSLEDLGFTPFPGPSVGGIAAAEVAPFRQTERQSMTSGVLGLFAGGSFFVAGYDGAGNPLPGWPVGMTTTAVLTPACGDLDGGGVPEVVVLGVSGEVLAWRANGTPVAGFPVRLGPSGSLRAAPALTDLDGRPGVEVLVATSDGTIHALGANGAELPGWPAVTGPSPVGPVVSSRSNGEIVVVVSNHSRTWWLGSDGRVIANVLRDDPGGEPSDLALGDLDSDGEDDVVVATATGTWAFHLDGSALPGWPVAGAPVVGSPVIGRVNGGSRSLLLTSGSAFVARDAQGQPLPEFPPYPLQTANPMFVANGADRSRIVLGSDNDLTFFVFDCRAPLDTLLAWREPRGNAARTGSRLYSPVLTPDSIPPGRVSDLRVEPRGPGAVALLWTAAGHDGSQGLARYYDIRRHGLPIDEANFALATVVVSGNPAEPGTPDSVQVTGLTEGATYYFALRVGDEWNTGPLSNVVAQAIPIVTPAAVRDLRVIAATDSIVFLAWSGSGEDGTTGRPLRYEVRAASVPIHESNFELSAYTRMADATVDAGGAETFAFRPLPRSRRFWFALKAHDAEGLRSPLSNVVDTVTIDAIPPARVSDLRAAARRRAGQVALHWTAPGDDGMEGRVPVYDIRWLPHPIDEGNFKSGSGGPIFPGTPAGPGLPDSVHVTGLMEGAQYYYALRGLDERNTGPLSNVASLTVPVASPAVVSDLHAVTTSDTSVLLAWTATGDDGTVGRPLRYELRASFGPIDASNFDGAAQRRTAAPLVDAGGTETFSWGGLEWDRRYWFALKAYDADDNASPMSNPVLIAMPGIRPARVNDLRVTGATDSSVTLSWTATGDNGTTGRAQRYIVRAALEPIDEWGFETAPVARIVNARVDAGGTETHVVALERDRRYWLALKAYDAENNASSVSNVISVTMPTVAPAAVQDLHATAITDSSVALAWTASGDDGTEGRARRYAVLAATRPDFEVPSLARTTEATVDAGGTETLLFAGLIRSQRYWFAVVAYDAGDNASQLSNVIEAATRLGGPLAGAEGLALALGSNPARGRATIYWRAEAPGTPHRLHVFDLTGRRVRSLDLGTNLEGIATWDGRNDRGTGVAAGLYVVRLANGSRQTQARLVLLPGNR